MNRVEFMRQLERLLGDIPESDRLDAIAYYNSYFDEAGPENEAKVIRELGSPGRVAAIIKADLHTSDSPNDFERLYGTKDSETSGSPDDSKREIAVQKPRQKRNIPWPLVIVLLVFASPILVGVGGGLLGGLLGLLGALLGVVVAIIACGVAFLMAGIVCFAVGVARIVISPVEGLITIGVGSLLLALGILFMILIIWCVFKWLPALFRGCVNLCQRLFRSGEERSRA